MKLILIVGLPASGKSSLLRDLSETLEGDLHYPPCCFEDWPGWTRQKERDELYAGLRAGRSCIVESSGFCRPEPLVQFVAELAQEVPTVSPDILYFDNNPAQCISNALNDHLKRYRGNGALARVSQVLRDCPEYVIKVPGVVRPVQPCTASVEYHVDRDPQYDALLMDLRRVLSVDGRPFEAPDYRHLPDARHEELIAEVEAVIANSQIELCQRGA